MTSAADIRNAIVTQLTAVAGIGKVHAYERFAAQQSKLKEFYEFDGRILGWNVSRAGLNKTMIADGVFTVRSHWEVRGYMSLEDVDETELKFDLLVDAVQAKLANDPTLGVAAWVPSYEIKAEFELVMFCGILCHSATVTFDSMHQEDVVIETALDDFITMESQYDIDPHSGSIEHAKWTQEPHDHSISQPELTDTTTLQE